MNLKKVYSLHKMKNVMLMSNIPSLACNFKMNFYFKHNKYLQNYINFITFIFFIYKMTCFNCF